MISAKRQKTKTMSGGHHAAYSHNAVFISAVTANRLIYTITAKGRQLGVEMDYKSKHHPAPDAPLPLAPSSSLRQ
jgi:hypothetical protein